MKRFISSLCVAALGALASAGLVFAQPAEEHLQVIHAGHLIAVPGERVRNGASIIIRNGRIESIEDGYVTRDGAEIVDLTSHWVLPGLIDAHVHLLSERGANSRLDPFTLSSADRAFVGARHARRTLEAGFTTVQDVGGDLEAILALRNAIRNGDAVGPRMRVAGPSITPTGGHGDVNGYNQRVIENFSSPGACNGPSDCARAVRSLIQAGVDTIKITATGGVLSNTAAGIEVQFMDDELRAIVQAAEMMGRRVTAHAHGVTGVNAFLAAGGHSIEHGTFLDNESIRLFRSSGAFLVPTVMAGEFVTLEAQANAPWMTPFQRAKALQVGPQMVDMLRRAHRGGVQIAFGTDSGVSRHGDNAREFELMVEAGMTPEQAIIAATINGARHLQMEGEIGRIAPGFHADIIAVSGNPLENISELRDVDFVMAAGMVHKAP
ncbi:amidohydrolase [Glycocaulis alkaliphilus]|uniref:Amidohydrolase n=1 Tax=Glycocaulis alkaliphilus TaxID=1434191 RepID=A0A3T0E8B5_9PROT|nr:amidohydrolase family protein [Glycocaulis alkaliphilus]AZU03655.1 amidohydrolase [Glycocaulis alkaliphilus]GGB82924.1 Xaa-Pro dipeptidase [Glycocaulis alkaliphilus]